MEQASLLEVGEVGRGQVGQRAEVCCFGWGAGAGDGVGAGSAGGPGERDPVRGDAVSGGDGGEPAAQRGEVAGGPGQPVPQVVRSQHGQIEPGGEEAGRQRRPGQERAIVRGAPVEGCSNSSGVRSMRSGRESSVDTASRPSMNRYLERSKSTIGLMGSS